MFKNFAKILAGVMLIIILAPFFPLNSIVPEAEAGWTCTHIESSFPNPQFRDCVSRSAGHIDGSICSGDIGSLTVLDPAYCTHVGEFEWIDDDYNNDGIYDGITGIQLLVNLDNVSLYGNGIANLTPMQNLANITFLDLHNNNITDISPLDNLTSVTNLQLQNEPTNFFSGDIYPFRNAIEDLTPLAGLSNLNQLYLDGNQISNLSGLSNKSNLIELTLKNNKLTNSSLSQVDWSTLTSLVALDIGNMPSPFDTFESNNITDLSALNNLPAGISKIYLNFLGLTDLSTLNWGNFTSLVVTQLNANYFTDISPLSSADPEFARGNSIEITYNGLSEDFTTYASAKLAVAELEGDGATVTHDLSYEVCNNASDDDADGNTDGDDSYCFPTTAYIDFDAVGGGECGMDALTACNNFSELYGTTWFPAMTMEPPFLDVTVNVQGNDDTHDTPQMFSTYFPFTDTLIQQWPGGSRPILHDTLLLIGALNTTVKGLVFYNNSDWPGLAMIGGNTSTIDSVGASGMGAGIVLGFNKNVTVQNSILLMNRGTFQATMFGFPADAPICGGVLVAGSNDTKIINNTFGNNCDEFNYVDDPNAPAAKLADLAIASLSFLPASSSKNTTVKQNLVYNNLTALPPALNPYTYYIDPANGQKVNGVSVLFPLTDDNAANHGNGNNFLEKVTDPFINFGGTDPVDYTLNPATIANFQTCTISPDTPPLDILGATRPDGSVEGGAVESIGGSCATGGHSQSIACSASPVRIDLPETLRTSSDIDGKTSVDLNWEKADIGDINMEKKIEIFLDFIEKYPDQTLGSSEKKLTDVFAKYMFNEIDQSINPNLKQAFDRSLRVVTDKDTDQVRGMLKNIGIQQVFSDWWFYFADYLLGKNEVLAQVFMNTLTESLTVMQKNMETVISGDAKLITPTFQLWNRFLQNFALNFKGNLIKLSQSSKSFSKIEPILSCIQKSSEFLAEKALARKEYSAATAFGDLLERIKSDNKSEMEFTLGKIRKEGALESILKNISMDSKLLQNLATASKGGYKTFSSVLSSNTYVQDLIDFYQKDENFQIYKYLFFATDYFKSIESCLELGNRIKLIDMMKNIKFNIISHLIENTGACDSGITKMLMDIFAELKGYSELKDEVNGFIFKFLNDLLYLEENLASASESISGVKTPFTDFYNKNFEDIKMRIIEGVSTEIYRGSERIATLTDPNITSYTDSNVPLNTTGKVLYYDYHLVTRTACDEARGSIGKAKIDPQIPAGTPVDVSLDLGIIVKEGYSKLFMERLQSALNESAPSPTHEVSAVNTSEETGIDETRCMQARIALLSEDKTSDIAFDYVMECYGDSTALKNKLTYERENIVPPLMRKLLMNENKPNVETILQDFMSPIIQKFKAQLEALIYVKQNISALLPMSSALISKNKLSDFTSDEKSLLNCMGSSSCDADKKSMIEKYFEDASHAIDVNVEVYDKNNNLISTYPVHTNLFGEALSVPIGEMLAGDDYVIKVRLADERFVLPKISKVKITTAEPSGSNKYKAKITLKFDRHFQYGNFDESDDMINIKDIVAWGKLLKEQPGLWDQGNLDGLSGINLYDAITLQQNWGATQEITLDEDKINLTDLAELFGLSIATDNSSLLGLKKKLAESAKKITAPSWLYILKSSCEL